MSISLVSWHNAVFANSSSQVGGETEAPATHITAAVAASGPVSQDLEHFVCRFQKARWVKDGSLDIEYLREAELVWRPPTVVTWRFPRNRSPDNTMTSPFVVNKG